ncbi:septum formation protein Maf [Legionella steigerwaltii]|uniref:Nucleoside triphosphate pyrophosphatase n=1 Tax=Legionella steigerwaltii TaxID=460 RepID=A0A378L8S2_9GAMM|nr:Maf family nucleotide pyrophosphatase [Legionella steigerwaltii]KTD77368.1 septum formation protein Maf [Legionella steigerwaltii]STY22248.1 septum formation protein Maf [Legionella steigerwaltii]
MSKFLQQKPIILASNSSIRFKLLQSLGIEFSVVPSHCDEDAIKASFKSENTLDLGYALAASKALEVSQHHPDHFIIAADQLCLFGQVVLNKPLNHPTAVKQLRLLSGKEHLQIACVCIAKNNEVLWQHHETAYLTLHHLSEATLEAYLQSEKPYQSCGSYQYENQGKWLFKEVQGNEDTILGLPLFPLTQALLKLGAVSF